MKQNRDLLAALIIVVLLTAVYIPLVLFGETRPSSLFGHGIGIAGFVLMLATETLYTLRKHSRRMARWGSMRIWLSIHIVMGITGPYMVFLHTGWQFAGLAGVTMLLTLVIVASGFVGRYIYTAVPRAPTGVMLEADQIESAIRQAEDQLQVWLNARPARLRALANQMGAPLGVEGKGISAVLGRPLAEWQNRQRWRRAVARLDQKARHQVASLERLLSRRRRLRRQLASLRAVRRLMALWHAFHVPLGMALFVAALVHIIGALYFS